MTRIADFYRLFPARPLQLAPAPTPVAVQAAPAENLAPSSQRPAPRYRERSPGTGYGRSSGYAKLGSYATAPATGLVRVC
jgi:hypothetical protein